jgi:hypothetical protein
MRSMNLVPGDRKGGAVVKIASSRRVRSPARPREEGREDGNRRCVAQCIYGGQLTKTWMAVWTCVELVSKSDRRRLRNGVDPKHGFSCCSVVKSIQIQNR